MKNEFRKTKQSFNQQQFPTQFKFFITISISTFSPFLQTLILFKIISLFLHQPITSEQHNITTLTLTHRIIGNSVILWVGLVFNNHPTSLTQFISSTITKNGESHITLTHVVTEVLQFMWIYWKHSHNDWNNHFIKYSKLHRDEWNEKHSNHFSYLFPSFHQFFKSPCLINQMKWKWQFSIYVYK